MKVSRDYYLHYGLYVHSELSERGEPIINLNKAIEELVDDYGVSISFVIKRRIFSPEFMKTQIHAISVQEIEMLFAQIKYENIDQLSYNEELFALKQAAILEVIKSIQKHVSKVVDNKVLNDRVDIRELHTIYPQQLITFFNKRSIWNRIQDAKIDLPFMSNLTQLQVLYLLLSFNSQPQVCSQYFPVRVVEYSKALNSLMSATLRKKLQPLLIISPICLGLANDYGPDPKGEPKHKKSALTIPYDKIKDLQVIVVPGAPINQRQLQIAYSHEQEQLRIVVESDRCQEIIRLIQDYKKPNCLDIGYDSQHVKPKTLIELLNTLKPLKITNSWQSRDKSLPEVQQVYIAIYERLNPMVEKEFKIRDILELIELKPNFAEYTFDKGVRDPYERYQLEIIANCCKTLKWRIIKKRIIAIVTKIQSITRSFLIRKRLIRVSQNLYKIFAARQIQKVFRGYTIRRKLNEFYGNIHSQ